MKKSYSELISIPTFHERHEYLYIGDKIGHETFGHNRYINQQFYSSVIWRKIRDDVIIRDLGRDLGVEGCDLRKQNILIHHINPITINDLIEMRPCVTDYENLICTSLSSHNYIHFGMQNNSDVLSIDRKPFDTCPWKIK